MYSIKLTYIVTLRLGIVQDYILPNNEIVTQGHGCLTSYLFSATTNKIGIYTYIQQIDK